MFKLTTKQEKEFLIFKLSFFLFLISLFLFGSSCQSIKKKAVQSTDSSPSRSLASLSRMQFNQLKRKERGLLSKLKAKPLKVSYTFLSNEKTGRICYVESFKAKNIIPPFAESATYEEARPFKKIPFPKCSSQEYAFISSYQNASILVDNETGVQVASWGRVAVGLCGLVSAALLPAVTPEEFYGELPPRSVLVGGSLGTVLIGLIKSEELFGRAALPMTVKYLGTYLGGLISVTSCVAGITAGGTYIYHIHFSDSNKEK